MQDRQPVVVAAVRTAQGKGGGVFADVSTEKLSVPLVEALLERSGVVPADVDDIAWGVARQVKEQSHNLARIIALCSSLGETVPGRTIDRLCASSAQAIIDASNAIRVGQDDVVVAGGAENMSRTEREYGIDVFDCMAARYDPHDLQMGMTAEAVADRYGVSRERQDAYGARSQQRACEATDEGRFDDEIVPIETDETVVDTDEGLRPGTTAERIAELPPAFAEDGTVTAATASQISDGAAALLLTSRDYAADHGLDVMAEVGPGTVAGVDPEVMGIGPVPAVRDLMDRTGRDVAAFDLVELNEAFASQTLYCQDELGFDDDVFNVNGGAIALGHPLGASGARLPVTLIHELRRRGGGRGLSTMCMGYGQGAAIEWTVT